MGAPFNRSQRVQWEAFFLYAVVKGLRWLARGAEC